MSKWGFIAYTPPLFDLFLQRQAGNFQVQCLADVLSWDTAEDIMMAAVSTWGDEISFKHSIVDIVWNRGLVNVINLPNLLGIMIPMINGKPFLANQYLMGWEKRFVFHGSKGDMAIRRDLRRDFNRKKWANSQNMGSNWEVYILPFNHTKWTGWDDFCIWGIGKHHVPPARCLPCWISPTNKKSPRFAITESAVKGRWPRCSVHDEDQDLSPGKCPTMWGPLVISWFISPNNYSYKYHKP